MIHSLLTGIVSAIRPTVGSALAPLEATCSSDVLIETTKLCINSTSTCAYAVIEIVFDLGESTLVYSSRFGLNLHWEKKIVCFLLFFGLCIYHDFAFFLSMDKTFLYSYILL